MCSDGNSKKAAIPKKKINRSCLIVLGILTLFTLITISMIVFHVYNEIAPHRTRTQPISKHILRGPNYIADIDFLGDGQNICLRYTHGEFKILDIATLSDQPVPGNVPDQLTGFNVSVDNSYLATWNDMDVVVVDLIKRADHISFHYGTTDPWNSIPIIHDLKMTPDGSELFSIAEYPNSVSILEWESSGRTITGWGRSMSGAQDATCFELSDSGYLLTGNIHGEIEYWASLSRYVTHTFHGHTDSVNIVKFSPDSSIVVSYSSDLTIRSWDISTGQQLQTLSVQSDEIADIQFTPDGKFLVSVSLYGFIRVWNLETGSEVLVKEIESHTAEISCLAISDDCSIVCSADMDDNIFFTDLSDELEDLHFDLDTSSSEIGDEKKNAR